MFTKRKQCLLYPTCATLWSNFHLWKKRSDWSVFIKISNFRLLPTLLATPQKPGTVCRTFSHRVASYLISAVSVFPSPILSAVSQKGVRGARKNKMVCACFWHNVALEASRYVKKKNIAEKLISNLVKLFPIASVIRAASPWCEFQCVAAEISAENPEGNYADPKRSQPAAKTRQKWIFHTK